MIANKYSIGECIGRGQFGQIFAGTHKNGTRVAIKLEFADSAYTSVKHEATILHYLFQCGCRCVPSVMYYGIYLRQPCIVMDHYDVSLDEYMRNSHRTLKQINTIMIRAIEILREVHECAIIHRDIKPANFMLRDNQLFLIDFGMAISVTGEGSSDPIREHIIGSPKYVSCHVHEGIDPSYRDDLISLGYCYIEFLSGGKLPWSQLSVTTTSTYSTMHVLHPVNQLRKQIKGKQIKGKQMSLDTQLQYMCDYLHQCYHTPHHQMPDYHALSQLFAIE